MIYYSLFSCFANIAIKMQSNYANHLFSLEVIYALEGTLSGSGMSFIQKFELLEVSLHGDFKAENLSTTISCLY